MRKPSKEVNIVQHLSVCPCSSDSAVALHKHCSWLQEQSAPQRTSPGEPVDRGNGGCFKKKPDVCVVPKGKLRGAVTAHCKFLRG